MLQKFDFIFKGICYRGVYYTQRTFNATNDYRTTIVEYQWSRMKKDCIEQPISKWQIQTYLSQLEQKVSV